jgi:hypothetical protein
MIEIEVKFFFFFFFFFFVFGTHDALDHLASFLSRRETISQPGFEPPTTPFTLGTSPLSYGSLESSWTILPVSVNTQLEAQSAQMYPQLGIS